MHLVIAALAVHDVIVRLSIEFVSPAGASRRRRTQRADVVQPNATGDRVVVSVDMPQTGLIQNAIHRGIVAHNDIMIVFTDAASPIASIDRVIAVEAAIASGIWITIGRPTGAANKIILASITEHAIRISITLHVIIAVAPVHFVRSALAVHPVETGLSVHSVTGACAVSGVERGIGDIIEDRVALYDVAILSREGVPNPVARAIHRSDDGSAVAEHDIEIGGVGGRTIAAPHVVAAVGLTAAPL